MPPLNNRPTTSKPELSATEQLLTRVVALIEEIIAVMDEEIPLIEGRKRELHADLLKRKQRLTLDYRSSIKSIISDPNSLRMVSDDLRAKARHATSKLAEASERNARALRAVMTASQRLVQSIVSIFKDEVLPKGTYANTQAGQSAGSYSPTCKPVTIYQSV